MKRLNDFALRSLTGLVYAGLWLVAALFSPHLLWMITGFFAVLSVLELARLLKIENSNARIVGVIVFLSWVWMGFLLFWKGVSVEISIFELYLKMWQVEIFLVLALSLFYFIVFVFWQADIDLMKYFAFLMLTFVYVIFSLQGLAFLSVNQHEIFYNELMYVLLVVWSYDTFAYIVGSVGGKHLLVARISPSKTWEGTLGGAFITLLGTGAYTYWHSLELLPEVLVVTTVILILATLGDLFESRLKRTVQVKDSGNILPGHGGVLDRLDSLLMVSMVYVPYVLWKNHIIW
ncbi:MAG: phosphatidate cytidylyltransferase [Bacteroidales bacterium]|nr:phosphatidate cytidylyltransferase [Bacteroidales bacterium]